MKLTPYSQLKYKLSRNSRTRLETCDFALQFLVRELSQFMDISVIEGHRTHARQNELFAKGASRSKAGQSKHNTTPSRAVDICPADAPQLWLKGKDLQRERYEEMWLKLKSIADAHDIAVRWGGDWDRDGDFRDQKFNDLVHIERV